MKLLSVIKAVTTIGPGLKRWIFSDGKFNLHRALSLILIMCMLTVMYVHIGPDGIEDVLEFLDEVSDIIGYAE